MRITLSFILCLLFLEQGIAQTISASLSKGFIEKFATADAFTSVPFAKCNSKEAISISEKTFWFVDNANQEDWDVFPVGQINYRDKYIAFVGIEVPFEYEEMAKAKISVTARIAKIAENGELDFIEYIPCYDLVISNMGGEGLSKVLESMHLVGEATSMGEFGFGIGAQVPNVGLFVSPFIFNTSSDTYRAATSRFKF